jgi:formate-dependent phosphoribosylglycinamide formyltransferase (GAR transformylase)
LPQWTLVAEDARGRVVRVLVLGAGPEQLDLIAEARRRGLLVVAADRDPAAPGLRLAHRRALVAADDEPAIERLARAEGVHAVVSVGGERELAIAARVARKLGLVHPPPWLRLAA